MLTAASIQAAEGRLETQTLNFMQLVETENLLVAQCFPSTEGYKRQEVVETRGPLWGCFEAHSLFSQTAKK